MASLKWNSEMEFVTENRGICNIIDATPEHGGNDKGPGPKELVLNAMMGCTAMDVMATLKKMRIKPDSFSMEAEAEKNDEHPIHFKKALLTFYVRGDLDEKKLIKATYLSLTKYCGVNYMISKTCIINFKVILNGAEVYNGKAFP